MSVIIPFIAFSLGGIWSFLPIFHAAVFIPIMDRLFQGTEYNLSQEEEAKALANKGYDYILWLTVPLEISLLCLYLYITVVLFCSISWLLCIQDTQQCVPWIQCSAKRHSH